MKIRIEDIDINCRKLNSLQNGCLFCVRILANFKDISQKWPNQQPHERSDLPPPVTKEQLGVRLTRQKRLEEFGAEEADRQQQLQMEEERAIAQVNYWSVQVLSGYGFSKISYFLERILMEHIDMKNSVHFELQISLICSIRIRFRK